MYNYGCNFKTLRANSVSQNKKVGERSLAGVAQWIECQPTNQRVTGSIPSQGTCLGCGPGPQGGVHERQPHTDVSLPPFPSSKRNK